MLLSVSVCVCLCIPPIVARQRFGRNVTAVTHATIEELLVGSFLRGSCRIKESRIKWKSREANKEGRRKHRDNAERMRGSKEIRKQGSSSRSKSEK
jgi:transcriptional regulator of met regulon